MFDTTELQVLVGVQHGKTLSQIGEELLLSHPSVSKTLRAAEHKAGLKLTEHHGRRLRLTVDGERLANAAQDALLKLRDLDGVLSKLKSGDSGTLRILASNGVCSYVLPPVVSQLVSTVREVDLHVQGVDGTTNIWEMFETGAFDVAIARTLPPGHVAATHLFDDELCLCVAASSELAERGDAADTAWPDLSNHTLVGPIDEEMWRYTALLGVNPKRRIRVSNTVLAKRFVEDQHAVALMYRSVAIEDANQGRIVILRLPQSPTRVPYWMSTRNSGAASPLLDKFVHLLLAHARTSFNY